MRLLPTRSIALITDSLTTPLLLFLLVSALSPPLPTADSFRCHLGSNARITKLAYLRPTRSMNTVPPIDQADLGSPQPVMCTQCRVAVSFISPEPLLTFDDRYEDKLRRHYLTHREPQADAPAPATPVRPWGAGPPGTPVPNLAATGLPSGATGMTTPQDAPIRSGETWTWKGPSCDEVRETWAQQAATASPAVSKNVAKPPKATPETSQQTKP